MGRSHVIASPRNPFVKELRAILGSRGIRKQGKAMVSGQRVVDEALATIPERCRGWITPGNHPPPPPPVSEAHWFQVEPPLFRELDIFGTGSPLLVVETPSLPLWDPEAEPDPGLTVVLPLQDPENLGAALRSARAFSVDRVVLLREAAHPYHPKAIRASAGAVFGLTLASGPDLPSLPARPAMMALDARGADLRSAPVPDPCVLVVGSEGPGLPPDLRRRAVAIPIDAAVDSLNAASALAVALYVIRNRSRT